METDTNFLSIPSPGRERWNAWLQAHRIGLAAYVLSILPAPIYAEDDPRTQHYHTVMALLEAYLTEERSSTSRRILFLRSLPPSILQLLAQALQQEDKVGGTALDGLLPEIAAVMEELFHRRHNQEYGQASPSPFGRAQTWAYHALLGQSNARRLLRLGRALFGERWEAIEQDAEKVKSFDWSLKTLRNPWAKTQDRCEAVAEIAAVVWDCWLHPSWAHIEHLLFTHQFFWPLLVFSQSAHAAGLSADMAIALPVAVHITFDAQGQTDPIGAEGGISVKSWKYNLRKDVRVAKDLWRAKHGNHGEFRETVDEASVQFDFRVAQLLATDLLAALGGKRFALDGGSADAYFAQAVLHRLLGRSGTMATLVTGCIGDQYHYRRQLLRNYAFAPPGGIPAKLEYFFACNTDERIVLPQETAPEVEALLTAHELGTKLQTAEVRYVRDLQALSDVVQVNGWRQYQYIHCPEVMWAVHRVRHGDGNLLEATHPRVAHILGTLTANASPVVTLPDSSPLAVASALRHLNVRERMQGPRSLPSLSWAFIRILDAQDETRFWHLLWRTLGASADEFQAFLEHPSREEAVARLADALNRFVPSEDRPYRAPDLIVLIGTGHFQDSAQATLTPLSRPFMVSPILDELSGRLRGPYDARLVPLIGKTRIIRLLTDDAGADEKEASLDGLPFSQRPLLRALATFERGFTQSTASLLLTPEFGEAYRGAVLRQKVLRPLVEKGVLREGQGWYHIPRNVVNALRGEEAPETLAQRYYRAGCALAPYISEKVVPALALDIAFSPEHVYAAERHFRLALQYARDAGDHPCQQASRLALQYLTRFAEIPSWDVVRSLLQADLSREAYETAAELLEWQRAANMTSHPNHLLLMARVAAQWAKETGGPLGNLARRDQLRQEAETYFGQALDHCAAFPTEGDVNRLAILTSYASYLDEHAPDRDAEINHLSAQALALLRKETSPKAAQAEWFELLIDREPDDAVAASLYEFWVQAGVECPEFWIKGLGAALLAGLPDPLQAIRQRLFAAMPGEFLSWLRSAYKRERQRVPSRPHVLRRLEEGFQGCEAFWGANPKVRASFEHRRGTPAPSTMSLPVGQQSHVPTEGGPSMEYACTAAVHGGTARCRNQGEPGTNRCALHREAAPAPTPEVVLVQVNLNPRWNQAFERAEIPLTMRTPETAFKLAAAREAWAKQLGDAPFSGRLQRIQNNPTQDPWRAVNTGTRVFGEAGARRVSIVGLAEALSMYGYGLVDGHRLGYTWKPSHQLVLTFEKDGEGLAFPWDLFHTFTTACFGYIQVWANPRNSKGLVVHTVQGGERDEQASPQWHLAFDRGAWKLAAMSFPRTDPLLAHRCA